MKKLLCFIAVFACLITSYRTASTRTWYVEADGTGDAPTIQAAIDLAIAGDIVLLASGTYTGIGNRDIDYLGKAITVTSESGWAVTIIDCERLGRGFHFRNSEGASSVLSDVTIMNGQSLMGAGIYCYESSPTIENNMIRDNRAAALGGGICCLYAIGVPQTISNNTIVGNHAGELGGGIYCSFVTSTFANNTISGNSAEDTGAGICCEDAPISIENTIVTFSTQGQGIYCWGANPTLTNCDVYGNAGGDGLCGIDGGGNFSSDPLYCGILGSDNYYLQSISPCAPANHPSGMLVGAWPVGCGTVKVEANTWGAIKEIYRD